MASKKKKPAAPPEPVPAFESAGAALRRVLSTSHRREPRSWFAAAGWLYGDRDEAPRPASTSLGRER